MINGPGLLYGLASPFNCFVWVALQPKVSRQNGIGQDFAFETEIDRGGSLRPWSTIQRRLQLDAGGREVATKMKGDPQKVMRHGNGDRIPH